ncbi:MAG: hypothetical protein ABIG95_01670 [Candidatus Woesearchaeota archaeon]
MIIAKHPSSRGQSTTKMKGNPLASEILSLRLWAERANTSLSPVEGQLVFGTLPKVGPQIEGVLAAIGNPAFGIWTRDFQREELATRVNMLMSLLPTIVANSMQETFFKYGVVAGLCSVAVDDAEQVQSLLESIMDHKAYAVQRFDLQGWADVCESARTTELSEPVAVPGTFYIPVTSDTPGDVNTLIRYLKETGWEVRSVTRNSHGGLALLGNHLVTLPTRLAHYAQPYDTQQTIDLAKAFMVASYEGNDIETALQQVEDSGEVAFAPLPIFTIPGWEKAVEAYTRLLESANGASGKLIAAGEIRTVQRSPDRLVSLLYS